MPWPTECPSLVSVRSLPRVRTTPSLLVDLILDVLRATTFSSGSSLPSPSRSSATKSGSPKVGTMSPKAAP